MSSKAAGKLSRGISSQKPRGNSLALTQRRATGYHASMPIEITMPRLSDTMESGTILKWNVEEGAKVSSGDVVADIETDKATMELTVYDDGTIASLVVPEGKSVDVGTTIALLAEDGEDVSEVKSGANGGAKKREAGTEAADEEDAADKQSDAQVKSKKGAGSQEKVKAKDAEADAADDEAEADEEDADEEDAGRDDESPPKKPARDADVKPKAKTSSASAQKASKHADEAEIDDTAGDGARMRISPVARRLADEHDIDLGSITGSGPHGRIIKRDVMQAIETADETAASVAPSAQKQPRKDKDGAASSLATPLAKRRGDDGGAALAGPFRGGRVPLSNMRQTIARRLVEAKQSIPHYEVTMSFNMDPLLEMRESLNEQLAPMGVKLSVNDFLVRCCALAMYEHPEFNASFAGDAIEIHDAINIGIAISIGPERGGGLVVGVIRNADQKSLRAISLESKHLAEKARTRGLSIDEMSDSTFTLSNLGMFGVEHFTAIINPPNSAILAVGAAIQKPVVREGELAVGNEMNATLASDHRVIDGAMAAQYLQSLKRYIESPATLLV